MTELKFFSKFLILLMVGAAGLEPAKPKRPQIYSLLQLPLCDAPDRKLIDTPCHLPRADGVI